jgi:hypothetical protein
MAATWAFGLLRLNFGGARMNYEPELCTAGLSLESA